jgi:SAM-dependent methyltransferase
VPEQRRWNHNIHYFGELLRHLPEGATSALDVGCGDGMLARQLRTSVRNVVGIDLDADQIALARASTIAELDDLPGISYIQGDVMAFDFGQTFDAVLSVATLHHLDIEPAIHRLAALVTPGGMLGIEGLARSTSVVDYLHDGIGTVLTQILRRTGGRRHYEHSAPVVWPPKYSYADIRQISALLLPGVRYKRHHLWRYTLIWHRPSSSQID